MDQYDTKVRTVEAVQNLGAESQAEIVTELVKRGVSLSFDGNSLSIDLNDDGTFSILGTKAWVVFDDENDVVQILTNQAFETAYEDS